MDIETIGEKHISVLLNELVESVKIYKDKKNIIVDATLGMGGHASKIIGKMNKGDIFIGFDADIKNLELAKQRIKLVNPNVETILINSNFVNLESELKKININHITAIYYDLGISSLHVDEGDRGFSFKIDGPLDMRFDKSKGKTAAEIVNSYPEIKLHEIFRLYGEEPSSRKIARAIIDRRKKEKFKTTTDLAQIITEITSYPKARNRIFQALRIEVNNELDNIKESLKQAIKILESDGTIFVISFHSLEDRIVKHILKRETRDCICKDIICSCLHKKSLKLISKKPILPTQEEIKQNQRARSAKARGAIKI